MVTRRNFIKKTALLTAFTIPGFNAIAGDKKVMTVDGQLDASSLGFTLTHEHVLADFIGAAGYSKERYDADEVFKTALPVLLDAKKRGCKTFIDCSPAYLGRDVKILKRLAEATGMHIITNTGYYGAVGEKFLPPQAYSESARQIADRWISEWKYGIEGTGIKPGFIKTSVDGAPLTEAQRKMITAAALAHLATGLTIAIHTDNGRAATEEIEILKSNGVAPSARIWVHAQKELDTSFHIAAAKAGGWISFEDVAPATIQKTVDLLRTMRSNNLLNRVLVSHDAGWYNVGEPHGGKYRNYNSVFDDLLPELKRSGFSNDDINLVFKDNPSEAFAIQIKKI